MKVLLNYKNLLPRPHSPFFKSDKVTLKKLPRPHSPFFKSDKVTLKKLKLPATYFSAVLFTVLQND